MALRQCPVCDRTFPDHRARCPQCGAANTPPAAEAKAAGGGLGRAGGAGIFLVLAVLAVMNVLQITDTPDGPDPAEEALHSPDEARQECRTALDSQFAAQDLEMVTQLTVDYLQGGEYEVTGTVDLAIGGRRSRRQAMCELQFSGTTGWALEQIVLDGA